MAIQKSASAGPASSPAAIGVGCVVVCASWVLNISELSFILVGAVAYLLWTTRYDTKKTKVSKAKVEARDVVVSEALQKTDRARAPIQRQRKEVKAGSATRSKAPVPDFRQESKVPVKALTFESEGWDAEVQELLSQIVPCPKDDDVVQKLVEIARQALTPLIAEVEIAGFASGTIARGKAFGVAVPDVDIVIHVAPDVLVKRLLEGRLTERGIMAVRQDPRKLQKSAIRALTDQLVSAGGFKFRRSSFKCEDPKVTLLAPASLGLPDALAIDLTVNNATPIHYAALLTECGQLDARAKELILLVKRWARDRGICHAPKGHLSPYAWCQLAIYFLQVGLPDGTKLLPALEGFRQSSALAGKGKSDCESSTASQSAVPEWSAAALFHEFVRFYDGKFDFRKEAVCVRRGARGPPELTLPIHIIADEGQMAAAAPCIEDPFNPKRNLSTSMNSIGLARLREELRRAREICEGQDASLAALLEPWVPPERPAAETYGGCSSEQDGDVAKS